MPDLRSLMVILPVYLPMTKASSLSHHTLLPGMLHSFICSGALCAGLSSICSTIRKNNARQQPLVIADVVPLLVTQQHDMPCEVEAWQWHVVS